MAVADAGIYSGFSLIPYWVNGPKCDFSSVGYDTHPKQYDEDPNVWGTMRIGFNAQRRLQNGVYYFPGTVDVHVVRERKIDKKAAQNRAGATLTNKGVTPAEIEITITLWTEGQVNVMNKILDEIDPRPTKKDPFQAYNVAHPAFQMRGVQFITIEKIEGPNFELTGKVVFKLNAVEWQPDQKLAALTNKAIEFQPILKRVDPVSQLDGSKPAQMGFDTVGQLVFTSEQKAVDYNTNRSNYEELRQTQLPNNYRANDRKKYGAP